MLLRIKGPGTVLQMSQQASAYEKATRVSQLSKKVRRLDDIFDKTGHAKWWNAFRQGIFSFWLPTFFSNDEVELWTRVNATISDLLDGQLTDYRQLSADLKHRLETLEAELTETKLKQQDAETNVAEVQHLFDSRRPMPDRIRKMIEQRRAGSSMDFTQ